MTPSLWSMSLIRSIEVDLEKKMFGGIVTLVLFIMYMELRTMKDKIDLLELKLETHMEFHEDINDYYDRFRFRNE